MDLRNVIDNALKKAIKEHGYEKRITRFDHEKDLNYALCVCY